MKDDIDIDCGPIASGQASMEEKGAEILDRLLAVASGTPSRSEALGYGGMEFVPWRIGAVMWSATHKSQMSRVWTARKRSL